MACGVILFVFGAPSTARAQRLSLTVSPLVITFPQTDPDTAPILNAPPTSVQMRVTGNGNRPWTLTVQSGGNLISGASQIPISNMTWLATPAPPFRTGTMSSAPAQIVAGGNGNVTPDLTGTVTFRLNNLWTYDAGTYLQVLVFTLSTP
jgi:hypothetical protein